ncbi:developmentally regulated GTP-binding protein-related [Schistosoma mansoni]|uniref:developmentally regulated GTP-binding protein-related n=1 Tax=Schistosoma mansoni TaxID=6183 RepID=UPI0001A639AD|nr:developmentally regulated GTP-binding protein-related [Schistosoma mansoni]|eukprot:XP_018646533.1 developmentally regulated GTP-binding protein-related [Schistosoma mansoni]
MAISVHSTVMSKGFIDKLRIFVRAGSGAAGSPPIKGRGGNGGSVFLEAGENETLQKLFMANPTKRFAAGHGTEASKRRGLVVGLDGQDLTIRVPAGITVLFGGQGTSSANGSEQRILGNLDKVGQKLLVAQGGVGGFHQNGLLKALSGAPAKIANYPFTTIKPQVAKCIYSDHREISIADLPGFSNFPRHTRFLKHVERSSCILLVLDSLGFCKDQLSPKRNALAVAYLILNQMERWSNGLLLEKPMACILNKVDTTGAMDEALETKYWLERMDSSEAKQYSQLPPKLLPSLTPKFESIELVSALRHTNIPELKESLRNWLDQIELRKLKDSTAVQIKSQQMKEKRFLNDIQPTYY